MFLNLFSAQHFKIGTSDNFEKLRETNLSTLKSNPIDRDALFIVGSIFATERKWWEAIQYFERLMQLDPYNLAVANDLSICYWNYKDLPSCYRTLVHLTGIDRSSWVAYDMLCVVAKNLGRKNEAVLYGEEAVRRSGSTYADPLDNLGCAYMDVRNYSRAASLFLHAVALENDNVLYEEDLALAYLNQGRYNETGVILDDLIARGEDGVQIHYLSALCCECEGKLDRAVSELRLCIERSPGHAEALRILGRVFFKMNDMRDSISSYILAEAMLAQLDYQDYIRMGDVYAKSGSHIKAIGAYEKSLAIIPSSDAHCALGNIYFELRNLDRARNCYSESLRLNPGHLSAQIGIANIYLQEDNFLQALIEYEKCLKLDPDYAKAHQGVVGIYLKQGNLAAALKEVTLWLSGHPNDSDAHYTQGYIYARLGDTGRAIRELENCLRYATHHKPAIKLLIELYQGVVGE